MTVAYLKAAQLDGGRMEKLRSLEKELGTWIVAVEPQAQVAPLSDDQVRRLQDAERELGVVLLACQPASTVH
jgi:hypothetical protein